MSQLFRLLRLWRPHAGWMALSILLSTAATLGNIGLMATSGWFITAMGLVGVAGLTMNYFTPAALIRALAIVRTGGRYLERLISHEATLRLLAALRTRLFAGLEPLVPTDTGDLDSSDMIGRLSADTDRLELIFLRLLSPLAVAALTLLVGLGLLSLVSAPITIASLLILIVLGIVVPSLAARLAHRHSQTISTLSSRLRQDVVDTLDGMAPLLIGGVMDARHQHLTRQMDALLDAESRVAQVSAIGQRGVELAAEGALLAALLIGIPLVSGPTQTLSGPDLTMIVLGLLASLEVLAPLPDAFANLSGAVASAQRIFAVLDRKPTITAPVAPSPLPQATDLTLKSLHLTYAGRDNAALDDISLSIPAGSRIAVVGESGAGKSTLMDLLLRFRDPDSGAVLLGGLDLRCLDPEDIRRHVCAVRQAPYLLTDSVEVNLRLGDPTASADALRQAMEQAAFSPVLETLNDGLNTTIGTAGTSLSGGEAKRLAIARALVADTPILILDEPGEGLDPQTEQQVISTLLARSPTSSGLPRTTIIFTHRKAGLTAMDQIVVLAHGRMVDVGCPRDVMSRAPFRQVFAQVPD